VTQRRAPASLVETPATWSELDGQQISGAQADRPDTGRRGKKITPPPRTDGTILGGRPRDPSALKERVKQVKQNMQ